MSNDYYYHHHETLAHHDSPTQMIVMHDPLIYNSHENLQLLQQQQQQHRRGNSSSSIANSSTSLTSNNNNNNNNSSSTSTSAVSKRKTKTYSNQMLQHHQYYNGSSLNNNNNTTMSPAQTTGTTTTTTPPPPLSTPDSLRSRNTSRGRSSHSIASSSSKRSNSKAAVATTTSTTTRSSTSRSKPRPPPLQQQQQQATPTPTTSSSYGIRSRSQTRVDELEGLFNTNMVVPSSSSTVGIGNNTNNTNNTARDRSSSRPRRARALSSARGRKSERSMDYSFFDHYPSNHNTNHNTTTTTTTTPSSNQQPYSSGDNDNMDFRGRRHRVLSADSPREKRRPRSPSGSRIIHYQRSHDNMMGISSTGINNSPAIDPYLQTYHPQQQQQQHPSNIHHHNHDRQMMNREIINAHYSNDYPYDYNNNNNNHHLPVASVVAVTTSTTPLSTTHNTHMHMISSDAISVSNVSVVTTVGGGGVGGTISQYDNRSSPNLTGSYNITNYNNSKNYNTNGNQNNNSYNKNQQPPFHHNIITNSQIPIVEIRDTPPSSYKEKFESNSSSSNAGSNNNNHTTSRSVVSGSGGENHIPVKSISRDASPSRSNNNNNNNNVNDHTNQELLKAHSKMSRRVVEELNRSQNAAERRIAAVTNACAVFDHDDESKHNIELYYGAPVALSKLLNITQKDDEIRMLLSALEMVFRGSPKQCNVAFSKVSQSLLITLLRLLDKFETRNMKHPDISILNISKIIYYLSRSSELRSSLCRPPAMLTALGRLKTRTLTPESRLLRVRIISNLANCDENKVLMYECDSILDSLLRVGHFDSNDLIRQLATTALMEFSSAPSNQISMARNETLVGTLVKIVLIEKNSTTRECSIKALQNLAYTKENRLKLVKLKDGIVLEALKKVLASDTDSKTRRRAAGTLTNLACEETAQVMGGHKGLVKTLAIVATKDVCIEVQTRAALALTKIASNTAVHMACHDTILDALVVTSLSKAPNSVAAVFRLKARVPANREALARHSGVVDTLCDIAVSELASSADRDNAIRAMMHLVNEDKNRKVLCNRTVLDALVTGANYTTETLQLEEARDSALKALQRLATEPSNRHYMGHHPHLIVTVSKAVEREALYEQQGRESEHGYLAKPLLLSLLVAM